MKWEKVYHGAGERTGPCDYHCALTPSIRLVCNRVIDNCEVPGRKKMWIPSIEAVDEDHGETDFVTIISGEPVKTLKAAQALCKGMGYTLYLDLTSSALWLAED